MSEFFSLTLNKDIVIDDSVTNSNSGWSGEKVLKEINKYRVTRFEELEDVDVINKEDKQVVIYSGDTNKFTTINLDNMGEAAGISLRQISKMGVKGSQSDPQIIDIPISTVDFKVPRINILKFQEGKQDNITIKNNFTNSESNNFEVNSMVVFNETARLKDSHTYKFSYISDIDTYKAYSTVVDISVFKKIDSLLSEEDGLDNLIKIYATPCDQILIPVGDINLSNVEKIDYFNLIASLGVKVICSTDCGKTWKTFNNNAWENINLSIDDMKAKGMNATTFNNINDIYWSNMVKSDKIRFAYLLSDTNFIDELKLQYDAQGCWIEVKESEYDIIYASNTLMQIKLYFSGDIKINY